MAGWISIVAALLLGGAGCWCLAGSGRSLLKRGLGMLAEFIFLWYVGAMMDFFPFIGDDFAVRAIGFTGLLICLNLLLCAKWITDGLRSVREAPEKEELHNE